MYDVLLFQNYSNNNNRASLIALLASVVKSLRSRLQKHYDNEVFPYTYSHCLLDCSIQHPHSTNYPIC